MEDETLKITFKGDEFKVSFITHEDSSKEMVLTIKRNIADNLKQEDILKKFAVLKNYLMEEGFFADYFEINCF